MMSKRKSVEITAVDQKRQKTAHGAESRGVYLMYNNCKNSKTKTYIGCHSDVSKRLLEHNGILSGGPRQTKKAQGHWKFLCILLVPPDVRQSISAEWLKIHWRTKSRGPKRRVQFGLDLAKKYNLYRFIAEAELDSQDEDIRMPELIKQFKEDDEERLAVTQVMKEQMMMK